MFDFAEKVVVVTGAGGALGRVVAQSFLDAGARVAVVDLNEEPLRGAFPDVSGGKAGRFAADLSDAGSVSRMVGAVVGRFGRVDVLANIAGGFAMGKRIHESDPEDWDAMLDMNARSVFLACRAVIPQMLKHGGGRIVNVGARAAFEVKGRMAPYIVSKMAVVRLTEALAREYREDNIAVNCVLPGTLDTPRNRADMPDADFSKWVPLPALAEVILFLASDAARAVHGAAVPVYGLS